jgi:hypothetical protein
MTSESDLISTRYGATKKRSGRERLIWGAVAASLLAIFLIWAVAVTIEGAAKITSQDLAYVILSPNQATVKFQVTKPTDTDVICAVQVLNNAFAVVGYREVEIAASAEKVVTLETLVNTSELGVTGLVDKCWRK